MNRLYVVQVRQSESDCWHDYASFVNDEESALSLANSMKCAWGCKFRNEKADYGIIVIERLTIDRELKRYINESD